MHFSFPLVATVVMAMLPSALATPVASTGPVTVMGTADTDSSPIFNATELENATEIELNIEAPEDTTGKRSYKGSCGAYCQFVNGNSLRCVCPDKKGRQITSTLNLNKCLTNRKGKLVWQIGGGYEGSCRNWSFIGSTFGTWCAPNNQYSDVNLDSKIHNQNGILTCTV